MELSSAEPEVPVPELETLQVSPWPPLPPVESVSVAPSELPPPALDESPVAESGCEWLLFVTGPDVPPAVLGSGMGALFLSALEHPATRSKHTTPALHSRCRGGTVWMPFDVSPVPDRWERARSLCMGQSYESWAVIR